MKVFYELTQKKRYDKHDKNDELVVSVRYRFQGKRLNKTTGVSSFLNSTTSNPF